jgi:hypothetical protein
MKGKLAALRRIREEIMELFEMEDDEIARSFLVVMEQACFNCQDRLRIKMKERS